MKISQKPSLKYEKRLWRRGFKYVAGVDEVGRGCFAGPVVAAAVVLAPITNYKLQITNGKHLEFRINNSELIYIDDSKKLTDFQREKADKWIKTNALGWGIGEVSPALINRIGMGKASRMAFRKAIRAANSKLQILNYKLDYLLIDAFYIPYLDGFPKGRNKLKGSKNPKYKNGSKQLAIIKGDEKSYSIAAASIIAKVYRDNLMISISKKNKYKDYGWEKNKGYGTSSHRKAILKYGISGYHRVHFVNTFIRKLT